MMDECKNCVVRGNLAECMKTSCSIHATWFQSEKDKRIKALEAKLSACKQLSAGIEKNMNKNYQAIAAEINQILEERI